ncbi:MAG: insulinase family protein, partial [Paludibacteraceae bacterium]|nr:insulinase family protein [Paludibacteraceae bacterium]
MKKILTTLLLAGASVCSFAQPIPKNNIKPLAMDPQLHYGVLPNGMTYYIRHNGKENERAHFYIIQDVGAILEEDSQNGLAHFLEHMAFQGTKNLPGKTIIEYMESVGVKFGSNINAYTSIDETVYNLDAVPTYRQGIIDTARMVLH